jgi:hypothetical protein
LCSTPKVMKAWRFNAPMSAPIGDEKNLEMGYMRALTASIESDTMEPCSECPL